MPHNQGVHTYFISASICALTIRGHISSGGIKKDSNKVEITLGMLG